MSANLLARETSPYLLQHKDNPVHWRPWGAAALEEARQSDRPILLSIGYAACHWCHVMAHESFEDAATAAVMNAHFVNIKVDREERPDIDSIYMNALHSLGEQGGWPLTMFLTADGEPFWGGTYFPPTPRYGRPGFVPLLHEVARLYREERDKLFRNRDEILKVLKARTESTPASLPPGILDDIARRLAGAADPVHGGIGGAPKFPQPFLLELLWRHALRSGDEQSRQVVLTTLDRMAQGGIYDHLGGGFARYAVDESWLVPHFEKMLYDNAQLVALYTLVWQQTRNTLYEARLRESIAWLLREMRVPSGAFAASLDADSEGEEGKFYVWTESEIDAALPPAQGVLFKKIYDVTPGGNWEGKTILNRLPSRAFLSASEEDALAQARRILLGLRNKRIRPGFDDKVLADWNGLMIAALAEAAMVFNEPAWLDAAHAAYDVILSHLRDGNRLAHAFRLSRKTAEGLSGDYAFMTLAALRLYETSFDKAYLLDAKNFVAELDAHFWDSARKGYYLTRDEARDILIRPRACQDDATPSPNAAMIAVHARLWFLTGEEIYRERADEILYAFAGEAAKNFIPLGTFFNAFDLVLRPLQIVLIGTIGAPDFKALQREIFAHSLPNRVVLHAKPGEALPPSHPASGKSAIDGKATVYVCTGMTCSLPLTDQEALQEALRGELTAHERIPTPE
jgi:uncharacterized protein YyaL (SSP411 family)